MKILFAFLLIGLASAASFQRASVSVSVTLATRNPTAGSPLQVDCVTKAPSGTSITWQFRGSQLVGDDRRKILSNNTLVISKADVSDSGEYICTARYQSSVATGSVYVRVQVKELEDASHEFTLSFLEGMEKAPALSEYLGLENADEVDDDIKTELGKKLKEGLDRVLEKIKDAVNEGRVVKQEFLDKLKELREKLREIKSDAGERSKELLKEVKEKAREYLKKLLEKYGLNKRSTDDRVAEALAELNYKDLLRKLREHLRKNVDPELLKEKIEKIFDQGSEILRRLLETLKEKGRRKLEILIDALLDEDDDDRESRSIKDYWEKVKDYFKDLKIDLQEKYMKFGEWVKNVLDKGKEHSKDKLENIKAIAKEFAKHVKNVSKEVGAEASEFFRQYKDELGDVWDELKDAFQQIRNRDS